jgi:cytochrome c
VSGRQDLQVRRAVLAALTAALLGAGAAGCRRDLDLQEEARALTQGGNSSHGHDLIKQYGCGSCHAIPGVAGASGSVGPSLASFRERAFIGGVLPHTPQNLMRWIEDPPRVDSLTAMPDLGVTHAHARDIAAYLYALDR